jgi:hypothetical protein
LTPQEAVLWSDFVADALELLDDAYTLLCGAGEWTKFVSGCHGPKPTEPDLTSGLGDRMRQLWTDAPLDSARDKLTLAYESPTPGDHTHGKYKPKADFRIERKFEAGYGAAFVIEAKSLRIPSDVPNKYLALDGIGCFTHRTPPYTTDILAGMLGYAHKTPAVWEPRLIAILPTKTGAHRQEVIVVDGAGRTVIASDHTRSAIGLSKDITILHTVLNFEFA